AGWPLGTRAQQPDLPRRLGILVSLPEDDPDARPRVSALKEGLERLGWIDGKNLHMEFRWTGDPNFVAKYATELVGFKPEVILTNSTKRGTRWHSCPTIHTS